MATTERVETGEGFQELTREEGWALLEAEAQRYLHMSAEEFLRKWDAREFENPDRPEIMRVAMALPFARS